MLRRDLKLKLLLAFSLAVAGCAKGDETNKSGFCSPACVFPEVCDPATKTCKDPNKSCTSPLSLCRGSCVDVLTDIHNCGGCGKSCGSGATAQCLSGRCECRGTNVNCNVSWSDGCECSGGCLDTGCKDAETPCDPNTSGSCDEDHYCDSTNHKCVVCPGERKNCDKEGDCDCESGICDGDECKVPEGSCNPAIKGACGGIEAFCNKKTNKCDKCIEPWKNCDKGTDCECQGLCDEKAGKCVTCETDVVGACDAVGKYDVYCTSKDDKYFCQKCADGRANCDRKSYCECEGTCDAAGECSTPKPCSDTIVGDCGDQGVFCNKTTGKCENCTGNQKNCDRKGPCTCDHTCDGDKCVTPCAYDDADPCGGDTKQLCYNGTCTQCDGTTYNCNLTKECECDGGCDGTACLSDCASCGGCCQDDSCIDAVDQTSFTCGTGTAGDPCIVCPQGTFCKGGQCVDCNKTNCPDGCCNTWGDCLTEQTAQDCGKGIGCQDCRPSICIDGLCVT